MLRLSVHCQPQVYHARVRLHPANMQEGNDRLIYLDGMMRYLDILFGALPEEVVIAQLDRIPFAAELVEIVEIDGKRRAKERSGVRQTISFDESALSIALVDGRNR